VQQKVLLKAPYSFQLPSDTLAMVGCEDETEEQPPEVEAAVREYLCIKTFLVSIIKP
jgi:hypothetical protein